MSHFSRDAGSPAATDRILLQPPCPPPGAASAEVGAAPDQAEGRVDGGPAGYLSEGGWMTSIDSEDESPWFDVDWAQHFAALSEAAYQRGT